MKPSEILKKGLELLGPNGEHWWNGVDQSKEDDQCMATSIFYVGDAHEREIATMTMRKLFGSTTPLAVWRWNDTPGRTFAEVKAKFLQAIKLAEAEEQKAQ